MRNANVFDFKLAHEYGEVHYGVVYDSMFGPVHRVKVVGGLERTMKECYPNAVLMESVNKESDSSYRVYAMLPKSLHSVLKGPSHTPKKPKRKPVKGTKPWTKIPYKWEDVEVGDVVEYPYAGTIASHKIIKKTNTHWYSEDGASSSPYWKGETAHILKPYKEPVKKEEEEVYRIGDWLEVGGKYNDIVQLVQVSAGVVKFIPASGNRLIDREISHYCGIIEKASIAEALDENPFTKISTK